MKKNRSVFCFFFLISMLSLAQESTTVVRGILLDEHQETIPFAVVSITKTRDTTFLTRVTANMDGVFRVELEKGRYDFVIKQFSFITKKIEEVSVAGDEVDLGKIVLSAATQELEEVVIEVERPQFSLQLDKRVFNVNDNISTSGASALEILENIPSVTVGVEGNVALRGSENVQILIDGKPSGLVGSDLSGLNQIQGSMIEKVEIITNPSSRFDAQGEVGIINIVLKKKKEKGLNGSVETTVGWPHYHKASVNLNYRTKYANFFGGVGIDYRQSPGRGYSNQTFYNGDTSFYYERRNERLRGGGGNMFRVGADFFLNQRNTLTITGDARLRSGENFSKNTYSDYNNDRILFSRSLRKDEEAEDEQTMEVSLRHEKTFKEKDRSLVSFAKLIESNDRENSTINQTFEFLSDSVLQQFSGNREDEFNFFAQSDYIHPLGKEARLESGVKSSFRVIENFFSVNQLAATGERITLPAFNNDFRYDEKIHAAYVQYGSKFQKLSFQLGLRGEYSDITTNLLKTDERNNRQYANLFPSAFFSTKVDSNSTLQWSYSRRISRPRFRELLPFYSFDDNRNLFTGNPDLEPVFTHSLELGYLRYFSKGSFLPSLYYRHSTGVIQRITVSDSLGATQTLPVNMASEDALGLELSANYTMSTSWKMSTGLNLFSSVVKGEYGDFVIDRSVFGLMGQMSSKWNIDKKTAFQAMAHYMSPRNTAQGQMKSMYSVDLALSREVLNKRGSLVFSVKDLFNSRKWQNTIYTELYDLESSRQRQLRQFTLSFTYHLQQPKKRDKNILREQGFGGDEADF